MIDNVKLAWLVGLLEGEGSFGYYSTQRVSIEMTDLDVMLRYADTIGRVCGQRFELGWSKRPHRVNRENWSETFKLSIAGKNARKLMSVVVPYMGNRRRAAIWRALNCYVPKEGIKKELPTNILQLVKAKRMVA